MAQQIYTVEAYNYFTGSFETLNLERSDYLKHGSRILVTNDNGLFSTPYTPPPLWYTLPSIQVMQMPDHIYKAAPNDESIRFAALMSCLDRYLRSGFCFTPKNETTHEVTISNFNVCLNIMNVNKNKPLNQATGDIYGHILIGAQPRKQSHRVFLMQSPFNREGKRPQ